mmetsp:Transcript_43509/g.31759  ORF Transcript_43509/g.31759 Transcript_43509/m.31759 type:complete len:176 (-) Transcript_43509:631-1158(-)
MSLPIPAGSFIPIFTLGAGIGRVFGYYLGKLGILLNSPNLIKQEAIYAIIGAASTAGAVTRSTSVAMIVFELTGQTSHMIPVLIGVLTSYAVAHSLAISIYDVILQMRNLPFLPTMTTDITYNKNAGDIMNTKFLYLPLSAKLADIPSILNKVGNKPATIPVVDSRSNKTLIFCL